MQEKIVLLTNDELDNLIKKSVRVAMAELQDIIKPSQVNDDVLMSPKEACEFLKFNSLTTLWQRVKKGLIPQINDQGGKFVFYRKSDLVKYQNSLEGGRA